MSDTLQHLQWVLSVSHKAKLAHLLVSFLITSFNTARWSCHRWRYAGNSAKNFLGKIFMSIHCIGGTLLPLYLSWCQITHLPKTETGPQMEQKRHDRNAARAAILEKHPLRKERPFWGGQSKKKWTKILEGARHIHKKYRMQKIWSKSVISALWSAESNLQRPMWGRHHQLDDQ